GEQQAKLCKSGHVYLPPLRQKGHVRNSEGDVPIMSGQPTSPPETCHLAVGNQRTGHGPDGFTEGSGSLARTFPDSYFGPVNPLVDLAADVGCRHQRLAIGRKAGIHHGARVATQDRQHSAAGDSAHLKSPAGGRTEKSLPVRAEDDANHAPPLHCSSDAPSALRMRGVPEIHRSVRLRGGYGLAVWCV